MGIFENIRIQGFRRLQKFDLELRPLCVLIGANGCGKTSLLDVFSMLAASASGGLSSKISDLGGIAAVATLDRAGQRAPEHRRVICVLSMSMPRDNPLVYNLTMAATGISYEVEEETLTQQRPPDPNLFTYIQSLNHNNLYIDDTQPGGHLVRPTDHFSPLETALAQVPRMRSEVEEFRKRLSSSTYYHMLNVEPRSPVRLPQPLRPATLPGKDGEDLVSCLFNLRETDRDRFEAIEDALKTAFPGFVRLDFPPVAAGTLAMAWKDSNFRHPLYMHQLSEGTLRFLWLATLLQSPGLTAVTLLDEPEVSLHPELLNLLADLMREASTRTQLIVATHADRLVRFLEPKEVVTFDVNDDGTAHAQWADQLDLDEWLKEYTLDEVWRLGRMGGRA
jgi:predicted ATPase